MAQRKRSSRHGPSKEYKYLENKQGRFEASVIGDPRVSRAPYLTGTQTDGETIEAVCGQGDMTLCTPKGTM
jgi:hypothetical protein